MTDMRRTLLWVVFSMSLVLLWDAWNRHTGQPSMFGPASSSQAGPAATPAAAPAATAAVPAAATPAAGSTAGVPAQAPAEAPKPAAASRDTLTITTDVVRATIDPLGGSLVRLELLKHADINDAKRPVTLFDQSDKRLYLAQTGMITAEAGVTLPNHLSPMRVLTPSGPWPKVPRSWS